MDSRVWGYRVVIVERDDHISILDRLIHDCTEGHGHFVLIDGPIGCGKTALLDTVAARAADTGLRLMNAGCSRLESGVPFGVLTQLFTDDPATSAELELAAAIPENGGSDLTDPVIAFLFRRLTSRLLDSAADTPVLIAVDDLSDADVPSLRFLQHLVRRVRTAPVLVVATDDRHASPRDPLLRAELRRQPHYVELRLSPLSASAARLALADRLAELGELPSDFHAMTGGNPALIQALADDLAGHGEPTEQGYGQAMLGCVHRGGPLLPPVARALAVLGPHAGTAEAAALLDAEPDAVTAALAAMTAAGLPAGDGFSHPVVRRALLGELSADEAADLHERAAVVLHARAATAPEIAEHLLAAGACGPPWATDVLSDAAAHALRSGDPGTAARCLELALAGEMAQPRRTALLARLARIRQRIAPLSAVRHLDELVGMAEQGLLSRQDRFALVRDLLWHRRTEQARAILRGLRAMPADNPAEQVELRDFESWLDITYPGLTAERAMPMARRRRREPVTLFADPWLRAVGMLADALVKGQARDAVVHAEQVLADFRFDHDRPWAEEAVLLALQVLLQADRVAAAVRDCDRLAAEAARSGGATAVAVFAAVRAEIAVRQGDFGAARQQARAALDAVPAQGWGAYLSWPLSSLVLAATRMGRLTEAADALALAPPDGPPEHRHGLRLLHARGHYHLAANHPHAALADFLSCGELMREWGLDLAELLPWRLAAVEAWLRVGNQDQARRLLYEQLSRLATDAAHVRGMSLRLLAKTSPPTRRLKLLSEALELLEASGDRFEQARVLADLSQTYNALAKKRRARLLMRQALHVADLCQAAPLSRELLALSEDQSGKPRPAHPVGVVTGIDSLTESERRVASLAVMGYTNREIARRLYITASTVEQHLTRVFRKLDVKSRDELPTDLWDQVTRTG